MRVKNKTMQDTIETWKDIPGYEGVYMASSMGNIKSLDRVIKHNKTSTRTSKGRILKDVISNKSSMYYAVCLKNGGIQKSHTVHKLIATSFHGLKPFEKAVVLHINENSFDNRACNLKWGTHSENMQQAFDSGRKVGSKKCTGNYDFPINKKQINKIDMLGNVIKKFDSVSSAARDIGQKAANIVACAKGRRRSAGGFKYQYV